MRVFALKGIGNDGVRRNTEMKRQRVENKLNRRNREEVIGGGGIAGMVCIALIIVFTNLFVMPVQAEPATLKSQEATVYEQSNEESAPVGTRLGRCGGPDFRNKVGCLLGYSAVF